MRATPFRRTKQVVGSLASLCSLFGLIRWFEHTQVYHPERKIETSGAALGRPWEDAYFSTADGVRLNGWFFPANTNSLRRKFAILLCHGNAGNISHRFDYFEVPLDLGVSVFAFDYRGYGASSGWPSEYGTYLDAEAARGWLLERGFAPEKIVAVGESLGGAVVAELARRMPIGGIALQSTFTSIPAIGAELFPWLPVRWISSIQYDTLRKLPQIRVPVMIMHSRGDSLVGFHHGQKNFEAANNPKLLWELSGDHNESFAAGEGEFRAGMETFLKTIEDR